MSAQPLGATEVRTSATKNSAASENRRWNDPLESGQAIVHLLNRITFGIRPGDVERVGQMGRSAFLEEQLHPERIDDSALETRLKSLPTLKMSSEELVENYPAPKPAAKVNPAMQVQPPAGPAMDAVQGPRRVIMELAQEELLRAVYSRRQLQEMMVQFWMNHFNIFVLKGADRWLTTSFERDTIRPRALGKFEDLLVATAQSPAMLFYLDNWLSSTPNPPYSGFNRERIARPRLNRRGRFSLLGRPDRPMRFPGRPGPQANPARQSKNTGRGLNENYAREVMELHTLGVDGGYTQKDVIEVARCLTGWTIDRPRQGGEFIFRPGMHDFGQKIVLGRKIKAGRGIEDGLHVLHILAHQPATAHFISLKLCRRFVSDDPPAALVDRVAKKFLKSDGDIREVLLTILTSPEFDSQAAYRAKVKTPLELVASALRGLNASTDAGLPLVQMIARMGQPMFQYQAPTGFPDRANTWINSGSLLARINFATLLAANRIPGTQTDIGGIAGGQPGNEPAEASVQGLVAQLVGGELSSATQRAITNGLNQMDSSQGGARPRKEQALVTGLLLASPEFQRR